MVYDSGWIDDTHIPEAAERRAPVRVFAAPMSERRTARYLSMDALDAPDDGWSGASQEPAPEMQ
jgi:hypothetical protein